MFQGDLAKKLKVDEMSIVNWELDRHIPSKKSLSKLRKILGVII